MYEPWRVARTTMAGPGEEGVIVVLEDGTEIVEGFLASSAHTNAMRVQGIDVYSVPLTFECSRLRICTAKETMSCVLLLHVCMPVGIVDHASPTVLLWPC